MKDIINSFTSPNEIDVQNNSITKFICESFRNLNLVRFAINFNEVTGKFSTCAIQITELKGNKVEILHIQAETIEILASNNNISIIECDKEIDLEYLDLNINKLDDLQCISSISTLERLHIDSNKFTHFKENSFKNMKSLKTISVMYNNLTNLDGNIFFTKGTKNSISRINIEKFSTGYDNLKKYYPKLKEIFHLEHTGTCEEYMDIQKKSMELNISVYFYSTTNCTEKHLVV